MKSPIFIFSLPRAGSTLLQRALMAHTSIHSTAEPWVLLPLVYALRKNGSLAEYSHSVCADAIEDFLNELECGKDKYFENLGAFVGSLYEEQCKKGELYFLDKTPRYYLIIPEIVKIFPNAKLIFLFRDPLHALSSMISTWSSGNLSRMYAFEQDILLGSQKLAEGYKALNGHKNVIAVRYEEFVLRPEKLLRELCGFLELEFDSSMVNKISEQKLHGRMGDPTGRFEYESVDDGPLNKFRNTFNSPLKKLVARRLLSRIDGETYRVQGYEKSDVIKAISDCSSIKTGLVADSVALFYSFLVKRTKAHLFFGKTRGKWFRSTLIS